MLCLPLGKVRLPPRIKRISSIGDFGVTDNFNVCQPFKLRSLPGNVIFLPEHKTPLSIAGFMEVFVDYPPFTLMFVAAVTPLQQLIEYPMVCLIEHHR